MRRNRANKSTQILWIFCEGETEKYYFQKLKQIERISRINILPSKKTDCINVVKKAYSFTKYSKKLEKGDRVFCVFDRNNNTEEQLQEAKRIATGSGIEIIFSNPSFEFWVLLHYSFYAKRCENNDIIDQLKKYIPNYRKADRNLYLRIKPRMKTAISNSQKVRKIYGEGRVEIVSRRSNPITLVDKLIDAIMGLTK